jgi:tripartite-type tricarboxylate transporter receptor subunit TctC
MTEKVPVALVVRASLPAKSLAELISYANDHPDELTFGSTGAGLFFHVNALLFSKLAHVKLRHVPYAQENPANDLLGGHIDMVFDALPQWLGNIQASRLRALAVTGEHRVASLPDVPTFAESGLVTYDPEGWAGLLAPKGVPQPIIDKMQVAIAQVMREPAIQERFIRDGAYPVGSTAGEFETHIRSESERWGEIIRENNLRIE